MSEFMSKFASEEQFLAFLRKRILDGNLTVNTDDTYDVGAEATRIANAYITRIIIDGQRINVVSKSGAYTATVDDRVIVASSNGGAFTITLPAASGAEGMILTVIKDDANANAVTLDGNGAETIDGNATVATIDARYDTITLYCNGTEWFIIAQKIA